MSRARDRQRAQAEQQPSAADRTTARRLGNEGVIALKSGDYDIAADRFERANDLVAAPSFLVLLARARVGQGRLVEAYEIYRTIIREGVQPDKPEAFKRALADAKAEMKGVEPRLAWVAVNVVGARPEQVEVTLNGVVTEFRCQKLIVRQASREVCSGSATSMGPRIPALFTRICRCPQRCSISPISRRIFRAGRRCCRRSCRR